MGELRLGLQRSIAPPVPPSPKEVVGGKGGPESKEVIPAPQPSNEWGVWVRGFGTGMRISNDASRPFDQDIGGFRMGADRRFGSVLGGDVFAGVFGGYIYGSRDFNDGGTGSTNALSLGGYATWIHPDGWYVDVVGKYTQLWNYFNTPTLENTVATGYYNIPAVGGSLEFGRRYDFGRGCFFVEPEVQLAGVWENGMSYNASNGLRVHGDSQTSLRGRIGGRLGIHLELSGGHIVEPYIRATADHEFLTGDTVRTNQTNFDPSISGTVGRFGAGVAARISQSFYLYGEYDYATGDHIQEPWAVNLGLRWQW
jgi:outer membrane autotransporter protein